MTERHLDTEILIDDEFVLAYVSDPGELSFLDALMLAIERDKEATEQFLASVENIN